MENLNYCLKSSRYELKKYYIKPSETIVFLGSSGVGKSSLVNKYTIERKVTNEKYS